MHKQGVIHVVFLLSLAPAGARRWVRCSPLQHTSFCADCRIYLRIFLKSTPFLPDPLDFFFGGGVFLTESVRFRQCGGPAAEQNPAKGAIMQSRLGIRIRIGQCVGVILTMWLGATAALAQLRPPLYREVPVYVKMDFWKASSQQTAEAWHFDPNNNWVWTQLPNDPTPPDLRARARFELRRLFSNADAPDPWVWFLGVPTIRVVRGSPGAFEDVSGDPQYSEMIDLMVIGADPETTNMVSHDPCGSSRIWPIATGSELTTYQLDDIGLGRHFGMHMFRANQGGHDGLLKSAAWSWKNPAGLAEQDVYIELTLRFDLVDHNSVFNSYHDTYVSWISAGGGCDYNFCLTQGQATAVMIGTPYSLGAQVEPALLVAAVPHTLDHTASLQLYKKSGTQNTILLDTPIGNVVTHHASHKCEPDGEEIPWHTHTSGQTGHLPVAGLSSVWFFLEPIHGGINEQIFAAASFNIPPHDIDAPTNHRALYMVFWIDSWISG